MPGYDKKKFLWVVLCYQRGNLRWLDLLEEGLILFQTAVHNVADDALLFLMGVGSVYSWEGQEGSTCFYVHLVLSVQFSFWKYCIDAFFPVDWWHLLGWGQVVNAANLSLRILRGSTLASISQALEGVLRCPPQTNLNASFCLRSSFFWLCLLAVTWRGAE